MIMGAASINTPALSTTLVVLLGVLALIMFLAWLLKRLPGSALRAPSGLKIIANLPIGARERLAVVEIGNQQLLLGITATQINCLHHLAQPLPNTTPSALLPDFAKLLHYRPFKNTAPLRS